MEPPTLTSQPRGKVESMVDSTSLAGQGRRKGRNPTSPRFHPKGSFWSWTSTWFWGNPRRFHLYKEWDRRGGCTHQSSRTTQGTPRPAPKNPPSPKPYLLPPPSSPAALTAKPGWRPPPPPSPRRRAGGILRRIYYIRCPLERGEGRRRQHRTCHGVRRCCPTVAPSRSSTRF